MCVRSGALYVPAMRRAPRLSLGLVLDCQDPKRQAEFWAGALGYTRLGGVENYEMLLPPDTEPGLPKLLLQKVPEGKTVKNRMHLDIDDVEDIEAEATRLEGLGATRVEALEEHGTGWIIMNDPEGNEFCVCRGVG